MLEREPLDGYEPQRAAANSNSKEPPPLTPGPHDEEVKMQMHNVMEQLSQNEEVVLETPARNDLPERAAEEGENAAFRTEWARDNVTYARSEPANFTDEVLRDAARETVAEEEANIESLDKARIRKQS